MLRPARALLFGAAVSLILHVAIALLLPTLGQLERSAVAARELEDVELEVRWDEAGDATAVRFPGVATPIVPGGAEPDHNVDARDRG
ncbi:MAG: hypothetical protein M3Y87_21285, partial [Myxococcota bacterium]|nr:hypothetical protein [Myxococcota bacterium]